MIKAAVPCVGYDDFLEITLPMSVSLPMHITVVTTPQDVRTARVARDNGVDLLATEAWFDKGPLNKAGALNEWLNGTDVSGDDCWYLILDADVVLPTGFTLPLQLLSHDCLYSARRRMCVQEFEWEDYKSGRRSLDTFPYEQLPVKDGLVWGVYETVNLAALCGYFHLWHSRSGGNARKFSEYPTAARYDLEFALSFPEVQRRWLPGVDVIHLGQTRVNWEGRISERWGLKEHSD